MMGALALAKPVSALGWLRITLRLLAMLLLLLASVALYYIWRLTRAHNPWPSFFLAGVGRIAGVRLRITGQPARQGQGLGGTFVLANHVSWIDIPALAASCGAVFVAHDGIASVPLLHWLCRINETVFVARHDRASIAAQVASVREAIREGRALTIFPEGTTSDGTGLLPFKSSLLSAIDPLPAGIAVQPVLLDYGPEAASIAWAGEEHGLDNFMRILARRRPVELTVHFLTPLSGEALANRKTMAAAAREALLRKLQG